MLAIAINKIGSVDAVKVVRSLEPELDHNAVEAVKQWKFSAATKDGHQVDAQTYVEVTFELR